MYRDKIKLTEVAVWENLLPVVDDDPKFKHYVADMEEDYKSEWVFHKLPVDEGVELFSTDKNVESKGLVPVIRQLCELTHVMEWCNIYEHNDKYYAAMH